MDDFHELVDVFFWGEDDELLFGKSVSLKKPSWLLFLEKFHGLVMMFFFFQIKKRFLRLELKHLY